MGGSGHGGQPADAAATAPPDRIWTVPNALSVLRLLLVPVFLYLLLVRRADAPAVAVLMISGASDWADGKIARLMRNQSSRLGVLLDPAADRIWMLVIPVALGIRGFVPWWLVAVLLARDVALTAMLPALRRRGLTALPVTYLGKAATFCLMSGFPLILLGQFDGLPSRVVLAIGWGFTLWGLALYLWTAVLYVVQFAKVRATMAPIPAARAR